MANTYTLISSNTLTSSAANVTFSSIPATYTDLVLRFSASAASTSQLNLTLNNSASGYSYTWIRGNGSAAASLRGSSLTFIDAAQFANEAVANTFSNVELYLPNYAGNQNKCFNAFAVTEQNAASGPNIRAWANLWSNTSAINEIKLAANAGNIDAGSSFYLYGIKNS